MTKLLIRNIRIVPLEAVPEADHPDGPPGREPVDLLIRDGLIDRVGPDLSAPPVESINAEGRWAIPGLWDQHVHAAQWLESRTMVDLSGTRRAEEVLARVETHIATLPPDRRGGVVRGIGYRAATWPRPGTVAELDAVSGDHPVVLIAGDVHNGWLNTAALTLLNVPSRGGMIPETEWFPVLARLGELPGPELKASDFARATAELAGLGLTGLVDLEFRDAFRSWPERWEAGATHLRVRAGTYPEQLDDVIAAGLRTGDALAGRGRITMGPLKAISDGSLGTRSAWCFEPFTNAAPDDPAASGSPNLTEAELTALLIRATQHGIEAAVHAIGDRANAAALSAFEASGAQGSIEHAQLLRRDDIPRMERLRLRASVQPAHLLDDRDMTGVCWADRTDRTFMFRSLREAGVELAFGSDAPVAPLDPWLAIAAAVHRSDDDRPGWHPEESLAPAEALAASVDGQRLQQGFRGDVVLLDRDPLAPAGDPADLRAQLRSIRPWLTVCAGQPTFQAT